ncbi:hypothetical protein EBZ39_19690 [bacterium]|nr:hypothetical protein [bacterium]
MISTPQIKALSDEELGYLVICLANEWHHLRMPYEFQFHYIKWFRNDSIQHILNKYSNNLLDEHKHIVLDILNKLEENK